MAWLDWDECAIDLGIVDDWGVVLFYAHHDLGQMPYSELTELGGADNFPDLLRDIKTRQAEANRAEGGYTGGTNVADYYRYRVTHRECGRGPAEAEKRCQTGIQTEAALLGIGENIGGIAEGAGGVAFAGGGAAILMSAGFTNFWNPVGWGLIVGGSYVAIDSVLDVASALQIGRAATEAQERYCDCTRFRGRPAIRRQKHFYYSCPRAGH